jgi:glycosyltransferase involved in cell wall biosynthesis
MSQRVLHILPHQGGGAETYIGMLGRLEGYDHRRFYLSSGRTPRSALASVPLRWPQLVAQVRDADILHCHGDVASTLALPLLAGRTSVVTTHGLHLLRRSHGTRRTLVAGSFRYVARRCSAVICTSASECAELSTIVNGDDREKLHVIANGVDQSDAPLGAERASVRDELGVSADAVVGLFIGQLEPRKGALLAAGAAARARAAGAPFVLAVAGDGPEAAHLQALAGDAVKPLGYRTDLERLLSAADVFVQTSEREGLSYALLEAMAHGLAVITTDAPGNLDAVGDSSLLIAPGDIDALVERVTRLCSDAELRQQLGAGARARARESFDVTRFLTATGEVYRDAVRPLTGPARGGGGARA